MRSLSLAGTFLVAIVLAGCGASAGSPESSHEPRLAMSRAEISELPQYKIRALRKPPPRQLVVKDLWKGSGAAMEPGDDFLVDFAGIRYGHAYETTPATRNQPEKFGFDEVMAGWKKGLPGMRVGGRRELIVPARLGSIGVTAIYVLDLLAVYPAR